MKRTALLIGLCLTLASAAAADDWGPWEAQQDDLPAATRHESDGLNPLKAGVRFFQKFISPVDGPRCRMYPTCSAYALQALDAHGPFVGTLLTVDRLLHEGSPAEHRHPVKVGDQLRFHDPLANNEFWLAPR